MFNSQSPSPQLGKSTYSSATRRDILWNVVQPGDPYDIRKSMIAKLPRHDEHFMGDNLEIVCLFQSAQIERLCQFLDDYKFRYREIERRELDRHSYEVQIKQLTQQLADESSLHSENIKLKDFIKKQTIQIQDLKNRGFSLDNNLRANYESALAQIQTLIKENEFLKQQKNDFILQINSYSVRIEALQSARDKQLKQLYSRYAEESKLTMENQTRSIKTRYQSEVNRLQFENKRLKQFNDAKNDQINELTTRNRNLVLELEELNRKKVGTDPAYIAQMQERFTLLSQEIQRLNLKIKQSTVKIDQSARNELYWKEKYTRIEQDYKVLQVRYKQTTEQFTTIKVQFEKLQTSSLNTTQIKGLQEQIQRLKAEIRRLEEEKVSDSQKYSALLRQYNELEYNYTKISVVERQNQDMRASQANNQDLKRKIAQYQTKIALLSQEVERLHNQIQTSSSQKQDYNELRTQYEEYRRKSIQNQRVITQQYEQQMHKRVIEYESKLAKYAEESGNQFEIRLQAINREVQKLNQYLKQKTQESEFNKKRIRQLENSINEKYEVEVKRQYSIYELTIKELRSQIEEYNRKYRDNDFSNKKIAEYENQIALLHQENERLNLTIRTRTDQNDSLSRKIRQLELRPSSNIPDFELNRKISVYEETQFKLTRENQDLRRRLQEIVELNRRIKQYEDRVRMLTQQNQRINMNLKEKLEALNRSQTNLRIVTQEVQTLRKNRQDIQLSYSQRMEFEKLETSRKFTNYQQSLSSIQREYEDLRRKMMDLGNDNNRKTTEYENKIVLLSQENERLNQTFKLKANEYQGVIQKLRIQLENSTRENRELQISITQKYEMETSRKINIYEQNMSGLNRELQDLRKRINQYENALRKKSDEINQLENRYRVVSQQYQSYKFQVRNFEGEVNRNHSTYQQNLQKITREYEQLKRLRVEYENRIALLSQENERLNGVIRTNHQEQQNLRRTINEMKIEITQKYEVQASRKINTYEQNISNLNRERDEYRRKIMEYQTLINNLNRELEDRNRKLIESQNKFRQLQITITQKYEVESTRKIQVYEQNIQNLGREMQNLRINYEKQIQRINGLLKNSEQMSKNQVLQLQELRRRLKEYGDVHRTIVEYENQFALVRQELERVNMNLKTKLEEVNVLENRLRVTSQENEQLKRKIKQVEITLINKYQVQFNQKSTTYEQNLGNFRRENDDLKRKIAEFENKIVLMTQEIERLNSVLKIKVEELNQSELRGRNFQQQVQVGRRKLVQLEKSTTQRFESQFTRTISVYEQNMAAITREYEQYKRQKSRVIAEYETKIALLSQQLQRSSQGYRLRTEELEKMQRAIRQLQLNSAKRLDNEKTTIISTYQQNMTLVTKQYQEYKMQTTRKISEYERKIMQIAQQLEMVRRQVKENELAFNQKYELEISRKVSVYETNFTHMKGQLDEYERKMKQINRKMVEDENKIAVMTQQIERLNSVLKSKVEQVKHYQNEVQKYILELQNVKTNLSNYYTTQIQKLNGAIKQRNEQYQLLQQKLTQLQSSQSSQFRQMQQSYTLVSKEYENSKKHLMEYQQSIRKLYSEFQRLQLIINELKIEKQTIFEKNHGLIQEIQRLTAQNRDQETQIYELRLKFSDQVSLQKRINEHMVLMVVLFAQIQSLRQRVKAKQKQVQEVRRSSLAPLKA